MQLVADSLGVDCEYCHDAGAVTAAGKPRRDVAREMIAMTTELNARVQAASGKTATDAVRVDCSTCHHGVPVPKPSPLAANSGGLGYIYSFNGPHSLFVDTIRSCRILGVAWQLGHFLAHENDRRADLLKRSVLHGLCTNQYIVFHGDSTHTYDVRGRTSHEAIFNRADGNFRCRSSQQGYSPFSTWTRGLAWAMLGYAEELEFFATIDDAKFQPSVGLSKRDVVAVLNAASEMVFKNSSSSA